MFPEFKHFPVHWKDGMKISSQEFAGLENSFSDEVRDARCVGLNDFRYGLLPPTHGEVDNYPKFQFDFLQQKLVLKECRAITAGGVRIEISERLHQTQTIPLELPSTSLNLQANGYYDVYLSVFPFERIPAGAPAQNTPPRYSFTTPRYQLSATLKDAPFFINSDNHLKISELEVREGRVLFATDSGQYFPPCISVESYNPMKSAHQEWVRKLDDALAACRDIVLEAAKHPESQDAKDALGCLQMVGAHLAANHAWFQWTLPTLPPLSLATWFMNLARLTGFAIEIHSKGPSLRDYAANCKLEPAIQQMIRQTPQHANIRPCFKSAEDLLISMGELFKALKLHRFTEIRIDFKDEKKVVPQDSNQRRF